MTRKRRRGNGEGSIYPVPGGYRAYVWVIDPDGRRRRKYVKAATYEATQREWHALRVRARLGPMARDVPRLADFLGYWLREVVRPGLAPKTYEKYEMFVRLYIVPRLGSRRLDKLQVRDVREWLGFLRRACQCCVQEKDARRPLAWQRCCAKGQCCRQLVSERTIKDARDALRAALSIAVEEELIGRNVAAMVRVPVPRTRRNKWWSVDEARQFLESARTDADPLYAAYVLVLVLGLRRGEVLGLANEDVSLDRVEIDVSWQLQRVGGALHRRQTKTSGSDAILPLPEICVAAFKIRAEEREQDRINAGDAWTDSGLVISTRFGTPFEPRNFNRQFAVRCAKAGVRPIRVHDTRRTCASLLVALDVHPRVAMQILRHSQIAVTMEVYSEVPSSATRDALRRLGATLAG